jgi:hypothetical protein
VTWIAIVVPLAAYLGIAWASARCFYARERPYAEPLSCPVQPPGTHGRHDGTCYRQPGGSASAAEAAWWAWSAGITWGIWFIFPGLRWLLAAGGGCLPEEVRYRELEAATQSKRDQDRAVRELAEATEAARKAQS